METKNNKKGKNIMVFGGGENHKIGGDLTPFTPNKMETIEEIEKNVLFLLLKKNKLNNQDESLVKHLSEKYPSFGFWAFNYHNKFFGGVKEVKNDN